MKNLANLLLLFFSSASIYIILYVGLGIGWPIGTSHNYLSINNVLENLSYSYLAGYIFYLLTTQYSFWNRKQQLRPVMKNKWAKVVRMIDDIVLEFSRDVQTETKTTKEDLEIILYSKNWADIIPMIQQLHGHNVSYIGYISLVGRDVRTNIMELIQLYKEYLSESQIIYLEKFVEMQTFKSANLFSSFVRVDLEDPNGKKCLVNDFIEMYQEMKSIELTFQE